MPDPLEEFDALNTYLQSRRFWSDLLTAAGFLVLLVCFRTGPLAPTPTEAPLLLRIALVTAMAGLTLEDNLPG